MSHCTHGGAVMALASGARCPWCGNKIADVPTVRSDGEGAGSVGALEARTHFPVAHIAAPGPLPVRLAAAALETASPPVSGAPSLFDPAPAEARWGDPYTSHAAAASITAHKQRDAYRAVLVALMRGPLTDFDLAAITGSKQTSIGKRRGELRDLGLVVECDRAGTSDTGSACIRWALTDAGRTEAERFGVVAA